MKDIKAPGTVPCRTPEKTDTGAVSLPLAL